jgi:hypothetical protein
MKPQSTKPLFWSLLVAVGLLVVVPVLVGQGFGSGNNKPVNVQALDDAERLGLLHMREEEKLARDVYLKLYEKWPIPIFWNIGDGSETQHMEAVKSLLDFYGLEDPAAGNAPGEFTDTSLQRLYNELTVRGLVSEMEALRVGVAIEELDIEDLERLIDQTDEQNIITVYNSLLQGSRNHLQAFKTQIELRGGTTSVNEQMTTAGRALVLYRSRPDPFNSRATISFATGEPGRVSIEVFDRRGGFVAQPFDGELSAGDHSLEFHGDGLPSGMYLYTVTMQSDNGTYSQTGRMRLVK